MLKNEGTFRARLKLAALAVSALCGPTAGFAGAIQGPSSSATPYNVPSPGVDVVSIISVGDSVNNKPDGTPYRMVGIPDGLGAYDNGNGTFTVLMNHELGSTAGIPRAHGSSGAFVSEWVIRKSDLSVVSGSDLIQQVFASPSSSSPGIFTFSRLCSADLPAATAFYNAASGLGTTARLFMNGEETGAEGRALATVATGADKGKAYVLPALGKFSWENSLANPLPQNKTIVMGTDDTTPGQVYMYVGSKGNTGNDVQRAGLEGGKLYGVKVSGSQTENRATGFASGSTFTMASLGDVSAKSGADLQTASGTAAVTEFLRPEDGAWNPNKPKEFYFVTTDRFDTVKTGTGSQVGRSRLYRLTFKDIANPELGGVLDMLLDGTGDYQMFDNITVDGDGNVLLMEDPGNNPYLARTWKYDTGSGSLTRLLVADAARFGVPTAPFSQDEENSGVIDITSIMQGHLNCGGSTRCYLGDTQAHYAIPGELVEGGQLYLLRVVPEPGTLALFVGGLGLAATLRRRRENA